MSHVDSTVNAAANAKELVTVEGARQIADGDRVIVGTGLPLLAALLAQRTHAPRAQILVESGAMFPHIRPTPISVVDPRIMHRAARLGSLFEALGGMVQRGIIETGFLGGAQIDAHGNINSSVIDRGEDKPALRLPGSGGANDIASHCQKVVVLTDHERRRFPERCDFVTSPGFLDGDGARQRAGLAPLQLIVVTNLCVLVANDDQDRLTVTHLMPGADRDAVLAATGFVPAFGDVQPVESPDAEVLGLLRTELDPERRYLGPR